MSHDPYKYFRIEAREVLDQLGAGVLQLEKEPQTPELVNRLFRLAHTLKGAARVVKQREIADAAHTLEDRFTLLRDGSLGHSSQLTSEALALIDRMSALLAELSPPPETTSAPAPAIAERREPLPAPGRADPAELEALLENIGEASVQVDALGQSAAAMVRAQRLAELLDEQLASPRLQRALNGSGARVHSLAMELRAIIDRVERELSASAEQMNRELREVRTGVEQLRMVPASAVFLTLERAARDAAQALGRRVAFQCTGGDLRVEGQLLGVVQTALVQIVRNAVAHGIEPEPERVGLGKPAEGRITVTVSRSRNQLRFACEDDGRGIDYEAVRRAASRSGKHAGEPASMDSPALLDLLLQGGITTSRTVTEIAGRGIGLDIVRDALAQLGGWVRVDTHAGQGTTFELQVPVSLASLPALLVESAGRTVALPLDAVKCTVHVRREAIGQSADGRTLAFEDALIPYLPLAHALSESEASAAPSGSAVVLERGGARAALGVDRLRGTETVVMRSLPPLTPADPVVAGASLDAAGHPQLVLDADELLRFARRARAAPEPQRTPHAILIVDDSLTTRMLEQSILEAAGYTVELATSGEEGLEKARQRPFSLFLVDVEMPGMNGFEFVETTRADPSLRGVPAILVTSRDSDDDRRRGVSAGAAAHIIKSEFNQGALLERIRSLLEAE